MIEKIKKAGLQRAESGAFFLDFVTKNYKRICKNKKTFVLKKEGKMINFTKKKKAYIDKKRKAQNLNKKKGKYEKIEGEIG